MDTSTTFQPSSTFTLPDQVRAELFGLNPELNLTSVSLIGEGVADLSFISAAQAELTVDGTAHALSWPGPDSTSSNEITLRPEAPLPVSGLLQHQTATMDASITATPPQSAWTLRIRGCFSGRLHVAVIVTPSAPLR